MKHLFDGFMKGRDSNASPEPKRSAAELRVALEAARTAAIALADKAALAQARLETERANYDADVRAFALGGGPEPDRARLECAISTIAALNRVIQNHDRDVQGIATDLKLAELEETARTEKQQTEVFVSCAEQALIEFERAITVAKEAEAALFQCLYSKSDGLKTEASSAEENTARRGARLFFRDRAANVAKLAGYKIGADFLTDGSINLSDPDRQAEYQRLQHARDLARLHACGNGAIEIGALVDESGR